MNKKMIVFVSLLLILIAVLSVVLAEKVFTIESNHVEGNVEFPKLVVGINEYAGNNTNFEMYVNNTVQITAILCDNFYRIYAPNITVTFYNSGFIIGTAVTDSMGNATIVYTIPPMGYDIYATANLVQSNNIFDTSK